MERGNFEFAHLDEFKSKVMSLVRRDIAGTKEMPFKLDLSAIEPAKKAAQRGHYEQVTELLDTWPGLLATLHKTPIAKNLNSSQLKFISEGLALLGDAFKKKERFIWAEELYRLGLQYVKNNDDLSGPLFLKLSMLTMMQKRYGESIGLLRRALALNQSENIILPYLADALLNRNRFVAAYFILQQAREKGIKSSRINSDIKQIEQKMKDAKISWPLDFTEKQKQP
jgi:tetratricopeptide (TPR) repeat protein